MPLHDASGGVGRPGRQRRRARIGEDQPVCDRVRRHRAEGDAAVWAAWPIIRRKAYAAEQVDHQVAARRAIRRRAAPASSVEPIAINSQNTNSVTRSTPASATPIGRAGVDERRRRLDAALLPEREQPRITSRPSARRWSANRRATCRRAAASARGRGTAGATPRRRRLPDERQCDERQRDDRHRPQCTAQQRQREGAAVGTSAGWTTVPAQSSRASSPS